MSHYILESQHSLLLAFNRQKFNMSPSLTTNSKISPLEFEAISITDIESDRLLLIRGNKAIIERLSLTFTANGKNKTFAVCLQLSVQ